MRYRSQLLGGLAAFVSVLPTAPAVGNTPTQLNDFGGVGLLQTPTARTGRDGQAFAGFSTISPYTRYFVTLQGLPWLEATLRYTDISNRLYGPEDFSGNQSYKDRAIDIKIRLAEEEDWMPALAVGFRDIGGTGLFQSEYVVASKRFGKVDASFGIGWGNMATRGGFRNPFTFVADRFKERSAAAEGGGALSTSFFAGSSVSPFGGIQWRTPVDGLSLSVEYDPNSYKREPLDNRFDTRLPINFAADYRVFDWLNLGFGYERGNRLMFRANVTANFHEKSKVPKFDPPAPPILQKDSQVVARDTSRTDSAGLVPAPLARGTSSRERVAEVAQRAGVKLLRIEEGGQASTVVLKGFPLKDPTELAQDVAAALAPSGARGPDVVVEMQEGGTAWFTARVPAARHVATIPAMGTAVGTRRDPGPAEKVRGALVQALRIQGTTLLAANYATPTVTLYVAQGRFRVLPKATGRIVRAAASILPHDYKVIEVVFVEGGLELLSVSIRRDDVEDALLPGKGSVEELWQRAGISRADTRAEDANAPEPRHYPGFNWSLRPAMRQTLGRPEAFVLYQIWARLSANAELAPGLIASGSVGIDIFNNFDKLRIPSDSVLPRVRTDIKEYLKEGTTALTSLQVDYNRHLGGDWYGHFYGGLLEEMFAGVGGEVMFRPFGANWAVAADLTWVKQRGYEQWFSFRDYQTVTGHAHLYYRFGSSGINGHVAVGRYLAKDVGATFELSRTFDSGITVGAFATFTNVSPEEFGEGRFDKGIYINVPLDEIFVRSSRGAIGWAWRPVIRDGGQILTIRRPLVGTTDLLSPAQTGRDFGAFLD